MRLDKHYGASWVEAFTAAFRAGDHEQTSAMLSEISYWGRENIVDYRDASEGLEEIVDGLHRLGVALPAGVAAWRDAFTNIATTAERPSLTRRARLIIIGGAAVAAAAYVYRRYRRTAKRADELEAIRSLLAGDSAVSLEEVTPQRRPSAKERSKVMERNKKLQAQKRAAEQARDEAAADAARARADNDRLCGENDRLRCENARLASNATAGDERDAARAESERLRTEVDRLGADIARLSENADQARVRMQRADNKAIADLRRENDALLAAKAELERHSWDVAQIESERAEEVAKVIVRDMQIERLRADKASLVAERDSLRAERDALEEDARLVPAPSAGDLAALPDDALSTFAAEAAALSHSLVREEARRAATATATTSECVVCQAAPLQIALGCGHFCACDACARGLSKCPICRAPVTERRRIYAS